jgi:nucleoside-diphosphate-sugar epimerase
MKLLVLGGTEFVGRAFVEEALRREWPVTVFNRGTHAVPEGVRGITGDRNDPATLAALDGEWDVVVDTWASTPAAVGASARALKGKVGRYVYVSSRSVYDMPVPAGSNEDAPLVGATPEEPQDAEYPKLKRGSELALAETFDPDRTLLVRAGLILGPYENVGRLPWWLNRMAKGGKVLAPGPQDAQIQYIDVRDLAIWSLDAAEHGLQGPYNLISPPTHTTMRELLEACVQATGSAPAASCRSGWSRATGTTPCTSRTPPRPSPPVSPAARSPRRSPTPGPGSSPSTGRPPRSPYATP